MDSNTQIAPTMTSILPGASELDAAIWRAVAGAGVKIPAVNSYVYYFPQGHLEQTTTSSSSSDDIGNYNFALTRPWIPCQVLRVRFHSNSASDQAFVRILLQPLQPLGPRPSEENYREDDDDNNDVVSFAKVLTRSDANNGGGFSVPRYCADMILPPLDFAADPPVQNLVLRDTHNVAWEFRHIYRGTPRRHLLTTGWSRFVNAKRLVAGDSVVFMRRRSTEELFVGLRRARGFPGADGGDRGEAAAAIAEAARGVPFEAVYYPRVGAADFVVRAEKVKEALRRSWTVGMRVRMAVETDDASRMTWIQGAVAAVEMPCSGVWCGSPWRMLQINWDDPEISQEISRVSPWQLEFMPFAPLLEPEFPPSKRLRVLQDSAMLPHGERTPSLPPPDFTPFLRNSPSSGIQRARQDHTSTSSTVADGDEPEQGTISTTLTIGCSHSGHASPPSRSSGGSSFQLFGRTIQMPRLEDGGTSRDAGCTAGGDECT